MTDLGGGVHDDGDAWADAGYQPHQHGPHEPAAAAMPRCPWCSATKGHELNQGALGGLLCGSCGNQFTSAPDEYDAMANRRALWREETAGDRPRSERSDRT